MNLSTTGTAILLQTRSIDGGSWGGTLLYVLSPIDILPDVFPIIGQIDDAVVITLLATELSALLKERNATMKQKKATTASSQAANAPIEVDVVEVK